MPAPEPSVNRPAGQGVFRCPAREPARKLAPMASRSKGADPAESPPTGRPWWTARECWTILGISRQRWQRLVVEQQLIAQTDDRGVQRFDPDLVEEIGERLGFGNAQDSTVAAMNVLRDTIETMSDYVKLVQSSERETVRMLREENDSLRKLRAEEQAAYLKNLEATQEALDHSAERAQMLQHAQGIELRQSLALEWLMTKIGPKIIEQWQASGHTKKIIELVRALDDSQVEALKVLVNDEQRAAIEALRKAETKEEKKDG